MRPVTLRAAVLTGLVVVIALPATTLAHAELVDTTPADGATVPTGPIDIVATFDEPLRSSSQMELHQGGIEGPVVARAAVDGRRLRIGLEGLEPGRYTVRWMSVGQDREPNHGRWSFTVAAASPSPTEGTTASPTGSPVEGSPASSDAPTGSPTASARPSPSAETAPAAGAGDVVLPIVVAILVLAALAGWLLRGRRRA